MLRSKTSFFLIDKDPSTLMLIAQSSPALLLHSSTSKPAPFVRCVTIGDMECYATAIHETRIEFTDALAKLHPTKSAKPVLDRFPNDSDIESRNPAAVLW